MIIDESKKEMRGKMESFKYIITDENGIHARPAGLLVKEAKGIASKVILSCNGKSVDATKLIAIMSLGAKKGTEVTVEQFFELRYLGIFQLCFQ